MAEGDLWLSPAVRLVADKPGVSAFEYNGRGRRIVLPAKAQLSGPLPLILVGSGKTLQLRNVTLVNSTSLGACLQLMPGSRLLAEPRDGVQLLETSEGLEDEGGMASPVAAQSPLARMLSSPRKSVDDRRPQAGADALTGQKRTMEISVSAVGLGLQFMQLGGGSNGNGSTSRTASGAMPRPASAQSLGVRRSSTEDMPRLAAQQQRPGSSASTGSAAPRSVQLLSAKMDLDVSYKTDGTAQSGQVVVQGLRMETRFIQDAAGQLRTRDELVRLAGA